MRSWFREAPWFIQALILVALFILVMVVGEYAPGLPIANARAEVESLREEDNRLTQEVNALQVYERRYAEFQQEMTALTRQLETLRAIVPEEKEQDEFMRLVQGAAAASGVQIRRLTAQPVVSREYHFDMPFDIQVDGPYYNIVTFFARLSRLSRIINVGDLQFDGLGEGGTQYPVRPATTVTGTCIVTTFYTMPAPEDMPADTAAAAQATNAAAPGQAQ